MGRIWSRVLLTASVLLVSLFLSAAPAAAVSYGVHIMNPSEIAQVSSGFEPYRSPGDKVYVTVPFTLADMNKLTEWQAAFDTARDKNIVPLVRVTTRFDAEKKAWVVPTRQEMLMIVTAMNVLAWPQDERHVILFNEPNHAAEWNGAVNPEEFAQVSGFLANWFQTEPYNYIVLPAAADLAAPNGSGTWEAFKFWGAVLSADPTYLEKFDAWNSHSYPNPGFIASPTAQGKNSMRGFEHELDFLAKHSSKQWQVYITETGWRETRQNRGRLASYYQVAHRTIWNNPQVVAVTPFVWQGAPGPFEEFSFLTASAQPTAQWNAFAKVLQEQARHLLSQRNQ
jgi:hypothetical protein